MGGSSRSLVQKYNPFEMVVNTTIVGSSGVGKLTVPLNTSGEYRYYIEWGDGQTSASTTTTSLTHTYPSGGTYTVKIYGRFDGMSYNNILDADKIRSINSWGNINWRRFSESFEGCDNLTGMTSNPPILEKLSDGFPEAFLFSKFNTDLSSWDVSKAILMNSMFRSNPNFNNGGSPSISGWTTSNCISFNQMFQSCTAFNQPIGSWDTSNASGMFQMFNGATNFNQDIGNWDVSNVASMLNMFNGATNFNNGGSPSISGWTFNTGMTSTSQMFFNATNFNQPIGSWDVSNVVNMSSMFFNAVAFNQDISSWDVSNVNNMKQMFQQASNFNQPIGSWDVSNVNNMQIMFDQATNFNQDIGAWDVSNVQSMSSVFNGMFSFASNFNNGGSPSISGWTFNTGMTDMRYMFRNATSFNQPIGSWDVSNVVNMSSMFSSASNFNQDIGSWDVSNVNNMSLMFSNASNFNQDISSWDVSNVGNMRVMFSSASNFNQPIGSWNVSNVGDMYRMFRVASNFNQDISNWNVSGVTDMGEMFEFSALDNANYNAILTGWTGWDGTGATKTLQSGVAFHAGTAKYFTGTTAEAARNYLITGLTWSITDGGGI